MSRDARSWHQRFDRLWRDTTRSTAHELSMEGREITAVLQLLHRVGGADFDVAPESLRKQAWSPDAAVAMRYVVGRRMFEDLVCAAVLATAAAVFGIITVITFDNPSIARWPAVIALGFLIGAAACLFRVARRFPLKDADRHDWEFAAAWQRLKWAEKGLPVGSSGDLDERS